MRNQTPQQVADARAAAAEREKAAAELEIQDFRWLMESVRGRRVVWRILSRAAVFTTSFSTVALDMAKAEGRKLEGYHTIALVHAAAPHLYLQMVTENAQ